MCVSSHLRQLHYYYKSLHKTVHSQFYTIQTGFPSHYFVKDIQVIPFTNAESADTSPNKNKKCSGLYKCVFSTVHNFVTNIKNKHKANIFYLDSHVVGILGAHTFLL